MKNVRIKYLLEIVIGLYYINYFNRLSNGVYLYLFFSRD